MLIQRRLNRPEPALPAEYVMTFGIWRPITTHTVPATCEQVGCPRLATGFAVRADMMTDLGQAQAHYIRTECGRPFTEEPQMLPNGQIQIILFQFPPGVECFEEHVRVLERPPFYVTKGGDWRGDPRGDPVKRWYEADWVDAFANHQDHIATRVERG